MNKQTTEFQASVYVFDLNNCAKEFGFKADENWEISMASIEDKLQIEKRYFPTLSVKANPEMLLEMLHSVSFKLAQKTTKANVFDVSAIQEQHLQFLVAFNPGRQRG